MTLRFSAPLAVAVLALAGCSAARPPAVGPRSNPPLALPPLPNGEPESYSIGGRDVLTVRVFGLERARELSTFDLEVDAGGTIHVPFAGTVPVAGKSVEEGRSAVAGALANQIVNPQVTVTVKEFRSRPITVLGAVVRGGVFHLQTNAVSLVEALSLAGGLSERAGTRAVVALPDGERLECDLVALLLDADPRANVRLEARSCVTVLPAEDFFVVGYVPRPGSFAFRRPITVTQAVGLAGGVDERFGSPSCVAIVRPAAGGAETIDIDLTDIAAGEAPDVAVRPGDTVKVKRTFVKAVGSIFETILGRFGFGFGYNLN